MYDREELNFNIAICENGFAISVSGKNYVANTLDEALKRVRDHVEKIQNFKK